MNALLRMIRLLVASDRRALARGMALSITVLAMGATLLALSGWFITAAAAAGLAGLGVTFNFFTPSAMVRLLALGRTAARYGERLTTHDATLRALSALRVRLLGGLLIAPYRQLERLRASAFLNRVTADIDALDGLALRLVLPGMAGLAVIALTAAATAWLVHPVVGLVIGLGYGVAPTLVFVAGQRLAEPAARRAEAGLQALRQRLVDMITAREELIAFGQLPAMRDAVTRAAGQHARNHDQIDRIDRQTGVILALCGWGVVAAVMAIGGNLAEAGAISPARTAIGIFAALALAEAVAPVRRALSEIGLMRSAARRIVPMLNDAPGPDGAIAPARHTGPPLALSGLVLRRGSGTLPMFAPLSLTVAAGETVALTGRSGGGKSSVLLAVAGEIMAPDDTVTRSVPADEIAMVPQRHALVAGTIAENLCLAAPEADETALWQALRAARLEDIVRAKGGLAARLGFRGAGLSGGEGRRLVLARAVLCNPRLLLLDEPTEGLDGPLAQQVLTGLRQALPGAAILMAAHRPEETAFADRVIPLG
ncbi:MAG: ATP-binding cassette domain-containing protein [Alphaproteobacteria bacterium]|jgi:ATP-binding cassette subfamily C protein CydC|nr:ATP-binding cassette domain-containing protein [Alphaproteobacteria bacterium]